MTTTPVPLSIASLSDIPAFIVGVTGNMDLDVTETELNELKGRVRQYFRFLKAEPWKTRAEKRQSNTSWQIACANFLKELESKTPAQPRAETRKTYRKLLSAWPRLENTPVIVLSSLAPGADTLVAEVALEDEFRCCGFTLICPLPLPPDDYVNATTFVDCPPKEKKTRIDTFRSLLKQVGENYFVVFLEEDCALSSNQLPGEYAKVVAQQPDEDMRRRRYQAAGEYMAAYAHVLIAISDDQYKADKPGGTERIIEARRSAPLPGLLPTTDPLGIPHGGPVLHLYAHRKKNKKPAEPGVNARFLQSYLIKPDAESLDDDAKWQQAGLALMNRGATNLDWFNEAAPDAARARKELCTRLTYQRDRKPQCLLGELQNIYQPLLAPLERLAAVRRRAADHSARYENVSSTTLKILFWLTWIAAVSFDIFAHWDAQQEHFDDVFQQRLADNARSAFATVAGLTAAAALLWYWWRRSMLFGERSQDYRALAEGARVQFYWRLAGIGQSVPANYMNRQRNELDWIRGAVRTATFPYEQAKQLFDSLPALVQVKALRSVLNSWVDDQRNYFSKGLDRLEKSLHAWHNFGNIVALAGFFIGLLLVFKAPIASFWPPGRPSYVIAVVLVLAVGGSIWWILHNHQTKGEHRVPTGKAHRLSWYGFWELVLPTSHFTDRPRHAWYSRWMRLWQARRHFLVSALIAYVTLGICHFMEHSSKALPNAHHLLIAACGCFLVTGAMAVAWTEKHLQSELAYQYSTMQSLFDNAYRFLDSQIAALEKTDQMRQAAAAEAATINPGDQKAAQEAQEKMDKLNRDYDLQLRAIQNAVFALGAEALDENAEWLILHRARPLEPVMAG